VTRRRQADTPSVASGSLRSRGSSTSPYPDGRRESTAGGGREHVRTTAMLVAVVLCFVIVELPQGLLAFLSGIDRRIFDDVYVPLGDVWDAAVIVNSAVNFILYCTMSSQFRCTFAEVICRRRHPDGGQTRTAVRRPGGGGGQTRTAVRKVQGDDDGGMLVCWRLILRSRTAPVSSLVRCTGMLSAAGQAKPPTPV